MVFFAPLSLSGKIATGFLVLIMALVALVYFAGVDLLNLARSAAYVSLAEDDAHPAEIPAPEPVPAMPLETPMLEGLASPALHRFLAAVFFLQAHQPRINLVDPRDIFVDTGWSASFWMSAPLCPRFRLETI